MATIPLYLQGENITLVRARIQTVNGSGVLADADVDETLTSVIDEIRVSSQVRTEEIVPLTSLVGNEVPIEVADQVTFTEILRANDGAAAPIYNMIPKLWQQWVLNNRRYVKFTLARGGTGLSGGPGGNSFVFYGLMTGFRATGRKGKNVATMTLMQVDLGVGAANPAYAALADP